MVWCLKAAEALVERVLGGEKAMKNLNEWFPKSAWINKERMKVQFKGRTDLKAPEVSGNGFNPFLQIRSVVMFTP